MAKKIGEQATTAETEFGVATFTRSVYDDEGIDLDRLDDFYTKVAGVSFKNKDGTSRQDLVRELYCGERLYLVRDPGNKHDPEAIKVVTAKGLQIGFIRAELADYLAPLVDAGGQFHVLVATLTGGDEETLGVNLRVRRLQQAPQRSRRRRNRSSVLAILAWVLFAIVAAVLGVVALAVAMNPSTGPTPRPAAVPSRSAPP